jgi:hypothetical protein
MNRNISKYKAQYKTQLKSQEPKASHIFNLKSATVNHKHTTNALIL